MLEHQFIPPTLHLTTPDPSCDLDYVAVRGRPARVRRSLINSFGFGGKNIVLALSQVDAVASEQTLIRGSDWDVLHNQPVGALAHARSLQRGPAEVMGLGK